MPINVTAKAVCHDCHKSIVSKLLLSLEPLMMSGMPIVYDNKKHKVIMASDDLVRECAEHHNSFRDPRDQSLPKHDTFSVYKGGKIIGEFSPPSFAVEVALNNVNENLLDEMLKREGEEGDHIKRF